MLLKPVIEYVPKIDFNSLPSRHLEDIKRIQEQNIKLVSYENSPRAIEVPQIIDEPESEDHEKLLSLTQSLVNEKKHLLEVLQYIEQSIDVQKQQISEQQREINALILKNEQLQQQQGNVQKTQEMIHHLESELHKSNQFIKQMRTQEKIFLKQLTDFVEEQDLKDIKTQIKGLDQQQQAQIILEYLLTSHVMRKNQEYQYEQHIKDNIQIIYDLQNKLQDINSCKTPKNLQSLKISRMSSPINESDQKIMKLKKQGKMINKQWQQFCENIFQERNQIIKKHKQVIEQLNDINQQNHEIINEILKYLNPKLQTLWVELMYFQQELNEHQYATEQNEGEIRLLYEKILYTKQKIDTESKMSIGASKNELKRALSQKDLEIKRLQLQLTNYYDM